jgi:hypothetical protein
MPRGQLVHRIGVQVAGAHVFDDGLSEVLEAAGRGDLQQPGRDVGGPADGVRNAVGQQHEVARPGSFELFGQLNNVIEACDANFDYQMRQVADLIGL